MGHPLLGESKQGRLLFWGSISKSKSCGHQHLLFCKELNEHWTFFWCSLCTAPASNHLCLTTTRFLEMDHGKIGGKPSHLAVKTRVLWVSITKKPCSWLCTENIPTNYLHQMSPYNPSIVGDLIGYISYVLILPTFNIFSHNIFGQVPLPIMIGYILSLILPFINYLSGYIRLYPIVTNHYIIH